MKKIRIAAALGLVLGVVACSAGVDAPDELVAVRSSDLTVTAPTSIGDVTVVVPPEGAPVTGQLAGWSAVPGLSGAIQCAAGSNLSITVSAEMFGPYGAYLRAKVDGVPGLLQPLFVAPGQGHDDVRAFTFIAANLSAGLHVVEIEWATASANHAPQMRDRSLILHAATLGSGQGRLAVNQSSSSYDVPGAFQTVPGLTSFITTAQSGALAITFSADTWVKKNRLLMQAVLDGNVVSEVVIHDHVPSTPAFRAAHRYTFVVPGVPAGSHDVELRASAIAPGSAALANRTLTVASAPAASAHGGMVAIGTQPATLAVSSTGWVDVPFLASNFTTFAGGSTAFIEAGAEVRTNGRLFWRALIDGAPARPGDVTLLQAEPRFKAQSFGFAVDNLRPGSHSVQIQAAVEPGATGWINNRSLVVHQARRSGSAFMQPFSGIRPKHTTFQTLVVCFDPLRPNQQRPTKAQLRNLFEGLDGGKSARGWFAENAGDRRKLGAISYLGCEDSGWFVPPPERQGNWYWDNGAYPLMWQDALRAADASFDFHARDTNKNGAIEASELLIVIARPQDIPDGTTTGTSVSLDGVAAAMGVHVSDLYLSALPDNRTWNVGLIAHEFSHSLDDARDLYSPCPADTFADAFSVMAAHRYATHLDPWHKLKSGFASPDAVEISSLTAATLTLSAVERGSREVTVLYDPARLDKEYFIVENRLGSDGTPTYDSVLGNNVVLWHVIEDLATRAAYPFQLDPNDEKLVRCRIPVRFLRSLASNGASHDFAWADGSSAHLRLTVKSAVGASTAIELSKPPCVPQPQATTCAGKQCGPAVDNCGNTITCPNTCPNPAACGHNVGANSCGCISNGNPCGAFQCNGTKVDNCGNVFTCNADCGLQGVCPSSGGVCRSSQCVCREGPAF